MYDHCTSVSVTFASKTTRLPAEDWDEGERQTERSWEKTSVWSSIGMLPLQRRQSIRRTESERPEQTRGTYSYRWMDCRQSLWRTLLSFPIHSLSDGSTDDVRGKRRRTTDTLTEWVSVRSNLPSFAAAASLCTVRRCSLALPSDESSTVRRPLYSQQLSSHRHVLSAADDLRNHFGTSVPLLILPLEFEANTHPKDTHTHQLTKMTVDRTTWQQLWLSFDDDAEHEDETRERKRMSWMIDWFTVNFI